MTRHKATQTGLGTPSPLDRWINALLRGLVMLVSNVARRFAPRSQTSAAECDESCDLLPEVNFVLDQHQEPIPAAACSHPDHSSNAQEGLMLRTIARAVVDSKHGERRRRQARFGPVDQIEKRTPRQGQGLVALSTSHSRASEARPENLWATLTNASIRSSRFRDSRLKAENDLRLGLLGQTTASAPN
jgi:hypothetical protein